MKENIKWERGKSNPLETYVDDQTATLTMLSNAAFVVGSECDFHATSQKMEMEFAQPI